MARTESRIPTTDVDNPFYCPSVPAALFLSSVRSRLRHANRDAGHHSLDYTPELTDTSIQEPFSSFAEILERSICEDDLLELLYRPGNHSNSLAGTDNSSFTSICPGMHRTASFLDHGFLSSFGKRRSQSLEHSTTFSDFSDFALPAKRERSIVDINETSFELSAKAEKIRFFPQKRVPSSDDTLALTAHHVPGGGKNIESDSRLITRIRALEGTVYAMYRLAIMTIDPVWTICVLFVIGKQKFAVEAHNYFLIQQFSDELHGLPIGTESPGGLSILISRLSSMLPGVRLSERLFSAGVKTHQQIVDVLAVDGAPTGL